MSNSASSKPIYKKPWLSWEDQVTKLESRGLVVSDRAAAVDFLAHINYYRFSGYCLAFESGRHQYPPNTTFGQIQHAYEFDSELRDLLSTALELVEIDVRTSIAYAFGNAHGAMGHASASNFHRIKPRTRSSSAVRFDHARWIEVIRSDSRRSSERFVGHFRSNYAHGDDLPIWVATEIMSFGSLSRMYQGMMKTDQKVVAMRYRLQPDILANWLHHLVYVRNICAHHARLWDRVWHIKPRRNYGMNWCAISVPSHDRLYMTLLILLHMMRKCKIADSVIAGWHNDVQELLRRPPAVGNANALMGLPVDWSTHVLWK